MVIVDTTVWIDYFRGNPTPQVTWFDSELPNLRFGLVDIILCEILQGIKEDNQFSKVKRELLKFEIFSTGGLDFAVKTAQNYRLLRSKGFTVRKTIDCWIATFCLLNDYILLHNDSDFDPFPEVLGLRIVQF